MLRNIFPFIFLGSLLCGAIEDIVDAHLSFFDRTPTILQLGDFKIYREDASIIQWECESINARCIHIAAKITQEEIGILANREHFDVIIIQKQLPDHLIEASLEIGDHYFIRRKKKDLVRIIEKKGVEILEEVGDGWSYISRQKEKISRFFHMQKEDSPLLLYMSSSEKIGFTEAGYFTIPPGIKYTTFLLLNGSLPTREHLIQHTLHFRSDVAYLIDPTYMVIQTPFQVNFITLPWCECTEIPFEYQLKQLQKIITYKRSEWSLKAIERGWLTPFSSQSSGKKHP